MLKAVSLSCRRFSVQRCARCHLGISASEVVMRARDLVYHLNCFTCTSCNKILTTGDHFGMNESLVYCRLHLETLVQGDFGHFNHTDVASSKALGTAGSLPLSFYNGVGSVQKGRPRKRKSPGLGTDLSTYNAGERCFSFFVCIFIHCDFNCLTVRLSKVRRTAKDFFFKLFNSA